MFRDYNSSYQLDISITNLPRVCESLFTFFSMIWTVYLREKLVDFVRRSEEKESHIIIKKGTLQVLKKKEMALAGGLLITKLTIKMTKLLLTKLELTFWGKGIWAQIPVHLPEVYLVELKWRSTWYSEKKRERERKKSGPFGKRLKGIERLHSIAFRAVISKEEGSTQFAWFA